MSLPLPHSVSFPSMPVRQHIACVHTWTVARGPWQCHTSRDTQLLPPCLPMPAHSSTHKTATHTCTLASSSSLKRLYVLKAFLYIPHPTSLHFQEAFCRTCFLLLIPGAREEGEKKVKYALPNYFQTIPKISCLSPICLPSSQ